MKKSLSMFLSGLLVTLMLLFSFASSNRLVFQETERKNISYSSYRLVFQEMERKNISYTVIYENGEPHLYVDATKYPAGMTHDEIHRLILKNTGALNQNH